jgi:hypothetical protein
MSRVREGYVNCHSIGFANEIKRVTRSEQNANAIIIQLIDPRQQDAPDSTAQSELISPTSSSFCILSYDRSIASSKADSPQRAI